MGRDWNGTAGPLLTDTEWTRRIRVSGSPRRPEHQVRSVNPNVAIDDSNPQSVESSGRWAEYVPSKSIEHGTMQPVLEPSRGGAVANPLSQVWAVSV